MKSLLHEFEKKYVAVEPGGCWVWICGCNIPRGTDATGNGRFTTGSRSDGTKRRNLAHRVSWEIHKGIIPDGLHVLHRCDVPACVNPSHLFLGTHQDNMLDCRNKSRSSAKLTAIHARNIRALSGVIRQIDIAEIYGIKQAQVSRIITGQRWRGAIAGPE